MNFLAQNRCSTLSVLLIKAEIITPLDFQKIYDNFTTSESRINFLICFFTKYKCMLYISDLYCTKL